MLPPFKPLKDALMLKKLTLGACALLFTSHLLAADNPRVLLATSLGEIEI